MKTIKLSFAFLMLMTTMAHAQWTRITTLPENYYGAISVIDGTIYTTLYNELYYSNNDGATWEKATIGDTMFMPTCIKKFGDRLYIGADVFGLYSAPLDNLSGPWIADIPFVSVTSMTEKAGALYVSTSGSGIYKLGADGIFNDFSNGLKTMDVTKLVVTPQSFIATVNENGTFYRFNVTSDQWEEEFYFDSYTPSFLIEDALLVNNTLYASKYNGLIRSEDDGNTWQNDAVGLAIDSQSRSLYKGQNSIYTLTLDLSTGFPTTDLRKRSLSAPIGSTWANDAETLSFGTFAIVEKGNKIYAATDQGVYYKIDDTLGNNDVHSVQTEMVLLSDPSYNGKFTLKSQQPMEQMTVYDATGKLIMQHKNIAALYHFNIDNNGFYIVKVHSNNTVKTFKVIVKSY